MNLTMTAAREELQKLLESTPTTAGILVRTHGSHLVLAREVEDVPGQVERDDRVRLTHLGGSNYGLGVRRHTGKWENTPFSGSLQEMFEVISFDMQHLVAEW